MFMLISFTYRWMETKGNGYNVNNVEAVVTYKVE